MKKRFLVSVAVLGLLAGCTTTLSKEDRAAIDSANQAAQEAKLQSAQAAQDAAAARADSEKAAVAARAASEKADKIFRQGQNK